MQSGMNASMASASAARRCNSARGQAVRFGLASTSSDRGKPRQRLGMRPIGDEDAWLLRDHFNCLRSQAPSQSTTITHIRIVSRIADTWS